MGLFILQCINKITNINHCRCYSSPGPLVGCGGPNGPVGDESSSTKVPSSAPAFWLKFGGGLYWGSLLSSELGSGGAGPDAGAVLVFLSDSLTGNGGGFT